MRLGFRTKVFIASVAASAVSLAALTVLFSWQARAEQRTAIERRLTDEVRLIADLLATTTTADEAGLDREADRLGGLVAGRVTLVAADGRVVGDSTQSPQELQTLDNHASRPEVQAARGGTVGVSRRHSATVDTDMLYVAVETTHSVVRHVRLALPLTDVTAQLRAFRNVLLAGFGAAIPVALLVSWALSAPLAKRVQSIARVAQRYSAGDLSQPVTDYGGDELGTVARGLDSAIQELGRRLAELSRDRARTEAILAGMIEGVLVVDSQGRLQLVNQAAQQMLAVGDGALGRLYVEAIRHPDITGQLAAALRGEPVSTREVAITRDLSRTFAARSAPVSAAGGGGAVLVLHEITDLRRADQVRRDFVANVSHELRTPLTAIRGYVEALLDEPTMADDARGFLEIVARHSARMERLVTDLLRLARLDARQELLDMAPCDVPQLLRGVVDDQRPGLDAKHQHVVIDVAPEAATVPADPAKLHDIVRNLVENAINYSPDRTEIRLTARRDGDAFVLAVTDTGPGIPPEDLARVFERFYRVDKSRARPGGTGLGLAIVKHLTELHGGRAVAANEPSGGARFTITLPVTRL
jgi:two-component system phosphate regulon sensor histidine kinase PhoR